MPPVALEKEPLTAAPGKTPRRRELTPLAAAIERNLQGLLDAAPVVPLSSRDRLVVFSDLHLGDGGPRDDFRHNAALMDSILRDFYLARGYSLVLNGDIEELQRFSLGAVRARWAALFRLFDEFRRRKALYKIAGNHDERLWSHGAAEREGLLDALRLSVGSDTLFIFHGHQAAIFFERFNWVADFFLRYVANTLRIANFPVTYESRKRYVTEHRAYAFSSSRRIVSLIGHTHRPLFESLSKIDTLKFHIERLCREYAAASSMARSAIEKAIVSSRDELSRLWEKDPGDGLRDSLYDSRICIPCLFNSGCAIGKRGVTAIEVRDGRIFLVHWFDRTRGSRSPAGGGAAERLGDTDFFRTVLKQDTLDYIFSRIRLLA